MDYSVAIRTLGKAGEKYQVLLNSLAEQTIAPKDIYVYIAEGYPLPMETIGIEKYIYVKKGMVSQRALKYDEIHSEYILFLDDDVFLPSDGVEKMFNALKSRNADVISPDVFPNSERPLLNKIFMLISGRMWPRKDDKTWGYRVMVNSGYSYNNAPSEDVYMSETNAGPCFLCSKSDFLKIHFEDELWLETCPYPLGEDQVMFYKMHCMGLKQLTIYNSGIKHLDAGTTLKSNEKEKSMIYSDFRFKTIFWHRYIYKPEKSFVRKLMAILAVTYSFSFALVVSMLKCNISVLRLKFSAIQDGVSCVKSVDYKKLPLIVKQ